MPATRVAGRVGRGYPQKQGRERRAPTGRRRRRWPCWPSWGTCPRRPRRRGCPRLGWCWGARRPSSGRLRRERAWGWQRQQGWQEAGGPGRPWSAAKGAPAPQRPKRRRRRSSGLAADRATPTRRGAARRSPSPLAARRSRCAAATPRTASRSIAARLIFAAGRCGSCRHWGAPQWCTHHSGGSAAARRPLRSPTPKLQPFAGLKGNAQMNCGRFKNEIWGCDGVQCARGLSKGPWPHLEQRKTSAEALK